MGLLGARRLWASSSALFYRKVQEIRPIPTLSELVAGSWLASLCTNPWVRMRRAPCVYSAARSESWSAQEPRFHCTLCLCDFHGHARCSYYPSCRHAAKQPAISAIQARPYRQYLSGGRGVAFVGIAWCWRFPVPFTLTIALGPGCVILGAMHFVFLKDLLRKASPLRTPILLSWASVLVQCSQLVIYPAVSALFEVVSEAGKIALTLIFPVIKCVIKMAVRKSGKVFGDSSEEKAIASVAISSSLYQSMIMQNSPSVTATAIIIGLDVLQGILAIKIVMDKPSAVLVMELSARRSLTRIRERKQANCFIQRSTKYVTETKCSPRRWNSSKLRRIFSSSSALKSPSHYSTPSSYPSPHKLTLRHTIPSLCHSMQVTND